MYALIATQYDTILEIAWIKKMIQLDIFSSSQLPTQLPAEVSSAIAWCSYRADRLTISFKMESPVWIGNLSLVQWLKTVTEITKHGADGDNVAIEIANAPSWLIDEARNYKSKVGGSNHPLNKIDWVDTWC